MNAGGASDEANAIGTAYLRIDAAVVEEQPELRRLFREHLAARMRVYDSPDLDAAKREYARAVGLQQQIWMRGVAISRIDPSPKQRRSRKGQPCRNVDPIRTVFLKMLTGAMDEAHNIALGLCPVEPEPDALAPALRALTRRMQETSDVHCEFLATGDVRVPDSEMAQHLYRIAQEALSNAVRRAHAKRIAVELRGNTGDLALQVEDNGVGLPPDMDVLNRNLFEIAPDSIIDTKVVYTIFAGRVVYDAKSPH